MRVRVGNSILTALLILTAVLFSYWLIKSVVFMFGSLSHYKWFLLGGVVYLVLAGTILKKNLNFFQTWIHESLHTFMCVVCFHRIEKFEATAHDGGAVYHYGGRNILISLAPYTLPLFTFILLILWGMIPLRFFGYQIFIGFTFFMHLHAMLNQIGPEQPDLIGHGLLTSYAYIFTFLPMNLAICIYAIDMKLGHAISYLFSHAWETVVSVWGLIF